MDWSLFNVARVEAMKKKCKELPNLNIAICGSGSVVSIATAYGLDGPGIKSRWGRDIPHLSRPALRLIQPPVLWVPGLSRV